LVTRPYCGDDWLDSTLMKLNYSLSDLPVSSNVVTRLVPRALPYGTVNLRQPLTPFQKGVDSPAAVI